MRKILCFIAIPLIWACSVKEDRSVCPCELTVSCGDSLKTEGSVLVSVIQDNAVVKQGMMSREDFEARQCRLTVPRKPSTVTVFTGITDMNTTGGRWLDILVNNECDEVYSCSENAFPSSETCSCEVTPHKNFIRMFLTILGMPEGAGLTVTGPVQGYDLIDQAPVKGKFSCTPIQSGETAEYCVRLPRQVDDGLMLIIALPGKKEKQIAIGKTISDSGYRFDATDLQDISITIDLSKSSVFVNVADWTIEGYITIEY